MLHPDTAYALYRQQETELAKRLRMRAERECCAEPSSSPRMSWSAAFRSVAKVASGAAARARGVLRSVAVTVEDPVCCPAPA